jgi:hypothetical protein
MDEALVGALSPEYLRRARAGRELAAFADVPAAAEALSRLLLDAEDTYVTRQTTEALAQAGTTAALGLIALALAEADPNHRDWIQTGICDVVLGVDDDAAKLAVVCRQLAQDPDERIREGTAEMLTWLAGKG